MKRSFIKFSKIEFPNVWFNFGTSWTKWNASQSLNRSFSKLFARCFWKRCSKYFSFEIIEKRWNNKYNLLQNNFTSWAIAPKFWNYFFFHFHHHSSQIFLYERLWPYFSTEWMVLFSNMISKFYFPEIYPDFSRIIPVDFQFFYFFISDIWWYFFSSKTLIL